MTRVALEIAVSAALLLLASTAGAQGAKPLKRCPPDAIVVGTVCMDKYEASVWRVPDPTGTNSGLVKKIQQGKATADHLIAGGAAHLGAEAGNYAPCLFSGQGCEDVYAVSLPGVKPSSNVTWFQAEAACRNARKRLPTNAEWQAAVAGTPAGIDDHLTTCNTAAGVPYTAQAGSRSACVSSRGAFDMVGNLYEWVESWVPRSTGACGTWSGVSDEQCLIGAATTGAPGALLRGGSSVNGVFAGPLAINGRFEPSRIEDFIGFRCAR